METSDKRDIEDWSFIYCIPFSVTKDTKLQDFQYKLIHRILIKNSFLYKCGLKETELCTFCTETKESLVHIVLASPFMQRT